MSSAEWGRFGEALVILLKLSNESLALLANRILHGLGFEVEATSEGIEPVGLSAEDRSLFRSFDRRKHYNYTPFTRSGEFFPEASDALLWDPYEDLSADRLEGGLGLFSAVYKVDDHGRPSYRLCAWPLALLERFLDELKPQLVREAWSGLAREEFLALLAGVCTLVKEKLADPGQLRAAHESAVVSFRAEEIVGEPLLACAEDYLRSRGHDPADHDLVEGSQRFFELALAPNAGEGGDPTPRARLGDPHVHDTRYSELLRCFGKIYVADLYHADHWLHGPMELLAEHMKGGGEGTEKGERAEDQVCDFMGKAPGLEVVETLRKPFVKRIMHEGKDLGDLDCPVRLGNTLIIAEVKAYALGYPVETVEHEAVEGRWEESQGFLNRVDKKAWVVAKYHKGKHYSRHLKGIRRILPVVCRPYPEWIPFSDRRYWLSPPASDDPGIPRILTPKELRNLLESAGEEGLSSLARNHLVEVS